MHPVIKIAAQLESEGKTPSLALVKHRLSQPMPMAEIIKALQQYRASPTTFQKQLTEEPDTQEQPKAPVTDQKTILNEIQKEIAELKTEVAQLKAEIAKLKRE